MSYNTDTYSGPSFSLKNRIARIGWALCYVFLFQYTPNPCYSWRAFLLRLFGAKIGKRVHIYPRVHIWAPWNISVGDESGIANDVTLYSQGLITIGQRAVISQGSYLCAGTHDFDKPGFPLITKPIVIGDHAWVAAQAFIHPGVTVNEGCVVGARSVVTSDLPEWTICSGFPAKTLKQRDRINAASN